jgi:transposase
MRTDEMAPEQTEQHETNDLKARIQKHRAEGKTYRDIAKLERVSIASISRALKRPSEGETGLEPQTPTVAPDEEEAATVFEMLENGTSLPKIVIELKMSPDKVRQLYDKWVELKKIDVNQPIVFEKIRELQELVGQGIVMSIPSRQLAREAKDIGGFRLKNCSHPNGEGFCTNWYWNREDGSQYHKRADPLCCAFCYAFNRV